MLTCERCGAGIPPNVEQCAYCGTVSEPARAALWAERARQLQVSNQTAAQLAVLRQQAFSVTEQASSRALMWGLLGFVVVCLPMPSVLSYLAFNRAQRSAREGGVDLPLRAKLGLACAALNVLLFVGFLAWMITDVRADNARVDARKSALAQQIAQHTGTTLDHPYACALAELHLLSNGFAGQTSTGSFRNLNCAGALHVVGERAELDDFKLSTSASAVPVTATLCFKHGEQWFVDRVGVVSCELE